MTISLNHHLDFDTEGIEFINEDMIDPKQDESLIPSRFEFDKEKSNTVGGVNYVYFDDETEDVIRISIRDTSLFNASFYAKSNSKGHSRAKAFRQPEQLPAVARKTKSFIFE